MDDTMVADRSDLKKDMDSKTLTRKILNLYMTGSEAMPDELKARCQEWLCLDRNWDVKDEVLMGFFDEAMEQEYVPTEDDRQQLNMIKARLGMVE